MKWVHFSAMISVLWIALIISPLHLHADVVVPSEDVTTGVTARQTASAKSDRVGVLHPGEQAEILGSVPNWHRVKLSGGTFGFVSKRWTRVLTTALPTPPASASFTIDAIDVGTGLAVFVRGPDFTLLYDGGSNDDLARGPSNRVLAFIRAVAPTLSTIDYMILSHPHRDHVELLPDLFAAYEVRQVWDSGRVNDICGYRAFLKAIRSKPGIQYHNALQDFGTQDFSFKQTTCYGQPLQEEVVQLPLSSRINETPIALGASASMKILHADGSSSGSPNENSLVVRLDLGATRILLMGDAEAGGRQSPAMAPAATSIEGQLLACCITDLSARVMVVGHHGSKTSSRRAFLDAVGASIFVVSSGPTKYGSVTLPDQEVINELTSRGQVLRTDMDDQACATNPTKIGPTSDGRAGGCDNIRVVISGTGQVQAAVWHGVN